ncbi:ABC transporter permease [Rhizobium puerariae]|uniref:ABC transporter permease n=1 Tax=Rhizobium puerariae TaxID=1585791 RepID=A0ABV6ARF6_9HYPH
MAKLPTVADPTTLSFAVRRKVNVIHAVMLRDMRTRYFNHGLGFLLVSAWPLCHALILIGLYSFTGRIAPYGNSLFVFFGTGLVPTLAFMYISRFMSISLLMNKPLIYFPSVKMVDILIGRALLEVLAAFLTVAFMFGIAMSLGDDPFPLIPLEAVYAFLASLFLAVGVGILCGVIVMFASFFMNVYSLSLIVLYLASGTIFTASALPEQVGYMLSWNPLLHCVEWMRFAYYEGYDDRLLDRSYLLAFALAALCLGLTLERLLRGKMLES